MSVKTDTVEVQMPAMGDSVVEGTILEWHKAEGDTIAVDETLVEISTDKVDAEVPSPVSGTIVKLHGAEGDSVNVGAVLAEIATGDAPAPTNGSNGSASATPTLDAGDGTPATADQAAAAAQVEAESSATSEASAGKVIDILTPAGGESVTEGTILEWSVKVGDAVKDGDTVVEISTDKVDMELPAPTGGTITEILAQEGETVTVGQVIGRMTADAAAGRDAPSAPASPVQTNGTPAPNGDAAAANASPVARRVAAVEGVDLGSIQGSARGGRITKADVLSHDANGNNGAPAPAPAASSSPAGSTLIKGSGAALARYMDDSRSIPTATSFRTLTVTTLDARRKQLKSAGRKVSFTHLIAYAIARVATEEMAVMAHHFAEVDGKPHRVDDAQVNLGLAVDVEKKDGSRTLMVPVIRDAGRLAFDSFLDAYNALVEKARTNSLAADDLQGANVSLTNPGGIGTIASVPRLMVGQGTIVATGSIAYPVGLARIGELIGAEKVMTMTSTYDHRIIQGAESGRFLQRIEALLQGEAEFYEAVFTALGTELPALPGPPAPRFAEAAQSAAPAAVEPAPVTEQPESGDLEALLQAVQAATSLLKAHRTVGHLAAHLDPLGREPASDPSLDPATLGLTPS